MARTAFVVVSLFLAALAGCLGEPEAGTQGNHSTEEDEWRFCLYTQHRTVQGGERLYSVRGCPSTLIESESSVNRQASIPANSTGVQFTFTVDLAEPRMNADITVKNGTTVLLDDQVEFVAGEPISHDGNDPDLDNRTRTTQLVLSACNATELSLDWGPTPTVGASVEVQSFNTERKAEAIESGTATCNLYWGDA